MSTGYCFTNLLDHVQTQCAAYKKGGIDAIAIIDNANITDYTSQAQWLAAIAAETVKIIKGIKAEIPTGSPVTGDNPVGCGNDTIVDGFDYTISIMDSNVSADNDLFWASLNSRQFYIAVRLCNESEILVIELPVTITASQATVPLSNKERQKYEVTFAWSADADWAFERVTEPAGIFD